MKENIPTIIIILVLGLIIYFSLNNLYHANLISNIIITIIALSIFLLAYRKTNYLMTLSILTSLTIFISLETSFDINLWNNFFISLAITLIFCGAYLKLKYKNKFSLFLFLLFVIIWIILSINVSYRHDWILENLLTVPFAFLIFIESFEKPPIIYILQYIND